MASPTPTTEPFTSLGSPYRVGLTDGQIKAIDVVERISSGFSFAGALFIIITFLFTRRFRRPINRLIFFASFGNILSNIGTAIGRNGIAQSSLYADPVPLCLTQAFLIQMFMPADALFALSMAINVYLNVKHKFEATSLRKLELYYVLTSYVIPFIVAFTFIFIKTDKRGTVYGDATLWCWISRKWDVLRIAAFYGPVWGIVLITFVIYACTFRVILRLRSSLKIFRAEEKLRKGQRRAQQKEVRQQRKEARKSGNPLPSSAALPNTSGRPLASSGALPHSGDPSPMCGDTLVSNASVTSYPSKGPNTTTPEVSFQEPIRESAVIADMYKSNSTANTCSNVMNSGGVKSPEPAIDETKASDDTTESRRSRQSDKSSFNEEKELDREADIESQAPAPTLDFKPLDPKQSTYAAREKARAAMRANRAAWAYARCAMLFFCGLIVTWLPSSMNRVYQYVHTDTNFVLSLLSAIVLPAQGFWNFLIYTTTSWRSVRSLYRDIRRSRKPHLHVAVKFEGCMINSWHSSDDRSDDED